MRLAVDDLNIDKLCRFLFDARELDLLECYHATHEDFAETLIKDMADACCLYDEDTNDVFAIWGVSEGEAIWMLCTNKVEEHPIAFLRYCREYLKDLLDIYKYLEIYDKLDNYVWLGNPLHVKWLKWMGATFGKTITLNGEPFQYFEFEKKE